MNEFIGVFDSGMGGITLLADLIKALPNENFIYVGDSANAPYGTKPCREVVDFTDRAVQNFISRGAKIIVIACNTATSASIDFLRDKYDVPIIGMEPAIKPAIENYPIGNIAVMATPMTLKLDKFNYLIKSQKNSGKIIKVPSSKLVEYVENGVFKGEEIEMNIESLFSEYDKKDIESIVLGCTHFLYLKNSIRKVFGGNIKIFDGNIGTVNRVVSVLIENGIKNYSNKGSYSIENTLSDKMVIRSHKLLKSYQDMR